jgi:hypothetical protein
VFDTAEPIRIGLTAVDTGLVIRHAIDTFWGRATALSSEALLFLALFLSDGLFQEPCKRGLSGVAVERVGRLLELFAVEQALNITRDGVGGHDEGRVERVDILAGH